MAESDCVLRSSSASPTSFQQSQCSSRSRLQRRRSSKTRDVAANSERIKHPLLGSETCRMGMAQMDGNTPLLKTQLRAKAPSEIECCAAETPIILTVMDMI